MLNNGSDPTIIIGLLVAYFAFFVVFYVWLALALGRVFAKLGEESWKAWVPVLNIVTIFRLGSMNPLFVLLFLVPLVQIVGTVMMVIAIHRINVRFGKDVGMTVLAVLVAPVWASILGFGPAVAIGGVPPTAARPPAPGAPTLPPGADSPPPAWAPVPSAPAQTAVAPPAPPAPPTAPPPPPPAQPEPIAEASYEPPAAVAPADPAPVLQPAPTPAPAADSGRDPWAPPIASVPGLELPPVVATPAPTPQVTVPPVVLAASTVSGIDTSAAVAQLPIAEPDTVVEPVADAAPEVDDLSDIDKTVVARRPKVAAWTLQPDGGEPIKVTKTAALLGRNPSTSAQFADAQLISIPDPSKTVSKTHARIDFADGVWSIIDLKSTNGVFLIAADGEESELETGVATPVGDAFRLGDLVIRFGTEK